MRGLALRLTRLEGARRLGNQISIIVVYEPADDAESQERGARHAEGAMNTMQTEIRAAGRRPPILTATVAASGHMRIDPPTNCTVAVPRCWCGETHEHAGVLCAGESVDKG